ncbi:MAG: site-specific integrase [Gemmatimonadaceae bacterium]
MLERYFVRPTTVDRIRSSWLGEPLDRYVTWLTEQRYAAKNVLHRVPVIGHFGEFARSRGAHTIADLPAHIDDFVEHWINRRDYRRQIQPTRETLRKEVRGPIEQFLHVVLPAFHGRGRSRRRRPLPFPAIAPAFLAYLREERGVSPATIEHYQIHLEALGTYLARLDLVQPAALSPVVLSGFITDTSPGLCKTSIKSRCGVLRVFLRYLYREQHLPHDLSEAVGAPQTHRLSGIPRAVTWEDVRRMLAQVDRRTVVGRRDYAILVLLVTYGLRGREVAALTLDDVDWRNDRLRVPERKGGHSTAYPLSPIVGQAILDYVQHGRPTTSERQLFFRVVAPLTPATCNVIGCVAARHLRAAGVRVPRMGAHTLRHTCVQRLVDAGLSLKTIGDYVGHRHASSTQIYSKVDVETLRTVACGDGEGIV